MPTKWIRSILAAVDLGDTTPIVLHTAEALTEATNARLHIAHAIELDWPDVKATAPGFQQIAQRAERDLAAAAVRTLREVTPESLEVVLFSRHRTITDRARQVNADLVVLGPHSHGRARLGTTVDRVLRTVPCPVWIARRKVRLPLGRIVVTTDMSAAGGSTLDAVASVIRQLGRALPRVEVVQLHVLHPDAWTTLAAPCRRELEAQADQWLAQHDLAGAVRVRTTIVRGRSAASGILSYLRRRPPDLLVLGTHGHGIIDRLLLGSVAARVLRDARCDALAVPPRTAARKRK